MDTNGGRRQGSKETLRRELGARIVKVRKRRDWSQVELARRLGVQRERLGSWERGRSAPGLEDLTLLSKVLEVPLEELGLGRPAAEPLSAAELMELARHCVTMTRLLKPWMERWRAAGGTAPARGK
jgi:putative transcriptional regulator